MKYYVVDASVVVNYLIGKNKPTTNSFLRILREVRRGEAKLYTSELFPYESANALRFSLKDVDLSIHALSKISRLPIEIFPLNAIHLEGILGISYRISATVYDVSYHYIAKVLGCDFVTCDKRYFKSAEKMGNILLV